VRNLKLLVAHLMGSAALSLCPMTSILSLYQRVKPMVRPPVRAWIR
jgi:hypothetical protein